MAAEGVGDESGGAGAVERIEDDRGAGGCTPSGITDPSANATPDQLKAAFSWYEDHSLDRFGALLSGLQIDIESSSRPPVVDNLVLIYAWNEWHEGGHIEPNVRDGCVYLNTVRERLKLATGSGCTPNPTVG